MQDEIIKKQSKTIYNLRFANLTDLHDYLKQDPIVNRRVFQRQASLNPDLSFYGESLEKSIEYCISGYNEGFDNFLVANDKLKSTTRDLSDNRVLTRSIYGGMPLSSLVAAGVPDCMLRYERDTNSVVRNIYFNLAYPAYTSASKIVSRGLATLYIIQALEAKGEMVNFQAFELTDCGDEIVNIEINLKKPGDLFLDIEKCYFPIKGKEFLRRILFRVLESSPVKNEYWGEGYGSPVNQEGIRKFFNTQPQDLIISYPSEMRIEGSNIYDDTVTLIEQLGLEEEFDIPKIKTMKFE
jgi:hypothetical protein